MLNILLMCNCPQPKGVRMQFIEKNTKLESASTIFFLHLFDLLVENVCGKVGQFFSVWEVVTMYEYFYMCDTALCHSAALCRCVIPRLLVVMCWFYSAAVLLLK